MDTRTIGVLVACFLTMFTAYAIRYSYGMLLPEMLPSLEISNTEAGVIYASFLAAYTVFSPILGFFGDRYDMRVLLTLFAAILGAGTFLMAYSSSIIEASLFFTLAGIGASACYAPVMGLAQRWVSEKRRGVVLSSINVGASLGVVIGGVTVPLIVMAHSWRMGWVSLGALAFLLICINFSLVKSHPAEKSSLHHPKIGRRTNEPARVTYLRLLRDKTFWLMSLSYLLLGFSIIIPFTFLSTYAVQEMAFTYEAAARLITVIGIGAIAGMLVLGHLSDTIGRIKVIILCVALIAAGNLGMAFKQGALILTLSTAIFGIGWGAVWAMYAASASDYFSKESSGSIIGLWTFYLGIGVIGSPIIAGWVADTTGTLTWSFVLAMASAVICLILLLPVWRALSSGPLRKQ